MLYNAPMEPRSLAVTFDADTLLAADPPPEALYAATLSRHGTPVMPDLAAIPALLGLEGP